VQVIALPSFSDFPHFAYGCTQVSLLEKGSAADEGIGAGMCALEGGFEIHTAIDPMW